MKDKFTNSELKAAYDICMLVSEHCRNVLAIQESEPDVEWNRKATKFIKAFERVNSIQKTPETNAHR